MNSQHFDRLFLSMNEIFQRVASLAGTIDETAFFRRMLCYFVEGKLHISAIACRVKLETQGPYRGRYVFFAIPPGKRQELTPIDLADHRFSLAWGGCAASINPETISELTMVSAEPAGEPEVVDLWTDLLFEEREIALLWETAKNDGKRHVRPLRKSEYPKVQAYLNTLPPCDENEAREKAQIQFQAILSRQDFREYFTWPKRPRGKPPQSNTSRP